MLFPFRKIVTYYGKELPGSLGANKTKAMRSESLVSSGFFCIDLYLGDPERKKRNVEKDTVQWRRGGTSMSK